MRAQEKAKSPGALAKDFAMLAGLVGSRQPVEASTMVGSPVSCEVTLKGNLVEVVHGRQRRSPRAGPPLICVGPGRFLPERVPLVVKTR
ncbi:MAG TPA: hypothetical protein VN786_02975 [Acidimicrobiales bacterium]|nr:hypothetical protein [Acidimicrobiales bacterium]